MIYQCTKCGEYREDNQEKKKKRRKKMCPSCRRKSLQDRARRIYERNKAKNE